MEDSKRAIRRRHSGELKARILGECVAPGASIARVALAHGLNPNLVHKWRRQASGASVVVSPLRSVDGFLPVTLTPNPNPAPVADENGVIGIELRRGATWVKVTWPVSAAVDCAAWMRELLK